MSDILCIKINQEKYQNSPMPRQLRTQSEFRYLPYDRVYILHLQHKALLPRLFKYYFSMPLTQALFNVIVYGLAVDSFRESLLHRTPPPVQAHATPIQDVITGKLDDYIMVIPTYRHKGEVKYLLSNVVKTWRMIYNQGPIPVLSFHTPTHTFPISCLACENNFMYYSNECTPCTYSCFKNFKALPLPTDRS